MNKYFYLYSSNTLLLVTHCSTPSYSRGATSSACCTYQVNKANKAGYVQISIEFSRNMRNIVTTRFNRFLLQMFEMGRWDCLYMRRMMIFHALCLSKIWLRTTNNCLFCNTVPNIYVHFNYFFTIIHLFQQTPNATDGARDRVLTAPTSRNTL